MFITFMKNIKTILANNYINNITNSKKSNNNNT